IFEFLDLIKTKRYTHTRISRLLIQFLLGFDNHDLSALRNTPVPKVKILAANAKGNEILASIRKKTEIRVTHNYEKELDAFEVLDTKASQVYSLLNRNYDPTADYPGFYPEMTTIR
ncbi:MAG TPA: nucleotidyltransferase family protein, partial [Clostridiaceae bacterium]|nr:nucleotidyltransferase family protein [Clostridiaceae bacterium]